jgi:cytoskeleton protein RodZ
MQTIGERLEDARKKKGISIREAAEATKIRGEYLQKFEGNQFEIGLTDIYTRGFLRGYANYLRIPTDRLLSDYTRCAAGEPRVRQPSREVYGRMDLAISSADDRGEGQGSAAERGRPALQQARFQRPGENLPKGPAIDPALVFKGGIALAVVLVDSSSSRGSSSRSPGPEHSPASRAPRPRRSPSPRPPCRPRPSRIVALDAVRIKVVRKSDGAQLFQGALQAASARSTRTSRST